MPGTISTQELDANVVALLNFIGDKNSLPTTIPAADRETLVKAFLYFYNNLKAKNISVEDIANNFTSKNIEGVLAELFQYVDKGKKDIASALTGKGVPASGSDTFPQLAEKINSINVGKRTVTGSMPAPTGGREEYYNSDGTMTVTGLPFKPKIICVGVDWYMHKWSTKRYSFFLCSNEYSYTPLSGCWGKDGRSVVDGRSGDVRTFNDGFSIRGIYEEGAEFESGIYWCCE